MQELMKVPAAPISSLVGRVGCRKFLKMKRYTCRKASDLIFGHLTACVLLGGEAAHLAS